MLTKYVLLAAISFTSTAMAIDSMAMDSQDSFNQNQTVRLFYAGMPTKDDILYGQPKADQTVLISQATVQQYTGVTTEFDLLSKTYVLALPTEQIPAIIKLNLSGETKETEIQAILKNVASNNSSLISISPPSDFQPTYKPNHHSFFSPSWGSSVIFTQKNNMALSLVPMAMFVLGYINAQK